MAEGVAGLLAGAIVLGAVHGIEPGHGWPVAASYALDRSNRWLYGFAASLILGVGHLVSSVAMVAAFFYAKSYFELTQLNEPVVLGGVEIGGPVSLVAGVLLIALGVREYRHGHSHGDGGHSHGDGGHSHGDSGHSHGHSGHSHGHSGHGHEPGTTELGHDHGERTGEEAFPYAVPADAGGVAPYDGSLSRDRAGDSPSRDGDVRAHDGGDTDAHEHGHGLTAGQTDRGLLGIAWFAFVLGFAHEEEFEIIALCAGSTYCLELMLAYAATVILGIVGLTLLLIAGYQEFEAEVERYAQYLPLFSAVVLVGMGLGFITGLF